LGKNLVGDLTLFSAAIAVEHATQALQAV